jgi:hypothetical protein
MVLEGGGLLNSRLWMPQVQVAQVTVPALQTDDSVLQGEASLRRQAQHYRPQDQDEGQVLGRPPSPPPGRLKLLQPPRPLSARRVLPLQAQVTLCSQVQRYRSKDEEERQLLGQHRLGCPSSILCT